MSHAKRLLARSPHAYLAARRVHALALYAVRRPHEPDFAAFKLFPERTGLFLDIGANSGQSALSFRVYRRDAPILSLEPNQVHEADLRLLTLLLRRFSYRICGAGAAPARMLLHVPVYRGLPLTGEASLDPERARDPYWLRQLGDDVVPGALQIRAVDVEIVRLDDLSLAPSFVKIDVEGGELAVVMGLERTIAQHRPVLLVEATAGHAQVHAILSEKGYIACLYDPKRHRMRAYDGQPTVNVFHVPAEAMPA